MYHGVVTTYPSEKEFTLESNKSWHLIFIPLSSKTECIDKKLILVYWLGRCLQYYHANIISSYQWGVLLITVFFYCKSKEIVYKNYFTRKATTRVQHIVLAILLFLWACQTRRSPSKIFSRKTGTAQWISYPTPTFLLTPFSRL